MKKDFKNILIKPHVTEKATIKSDKGVYVFKVARDAKKSDVLKSVKEFYGVSPLKINIVNSPSKTVFVRGKRGVKSGHKKAYVFLNKGEKIEVL